MKQKNAIELKIKLKRLFLSYIIYNNEEAYQEPRHTSKTKIYANIYANIAKESQSLNIFQKTPSQKSSRVPNTCYKIVVRKFPIYKLKQKMTKRS